MSSARPEPVPTFSPRIPAPSRRQAASGTAATGPPDRETWSGVLHDVRGAATAIDALADLVADESPGLSPGSRGLLSLIQARADQLAALCDAMAWLQERPEDRPAGRLPLEEIIRRATGRLQKFLNRAGLGLKSMGGIPDMECEARPLAVLLQSVLLLATNARATSQAGAVQLEVLVVNGTPRIAIELSGSGWNRPALEALLALAVPRRDQDLDQARAPLQLAAHQALAHLRARLDASLRPGPGRTGDRLAVVIELQPPGRQEDMLGAEARS